MSRYAFSNFAVMALSLAFLGDFSIGDLGLNSVSRVFDGAVGVGEGPSKTKACEAATQQATTRVSAAHLNNIEGKSCSCTQRAGSVETWRCVASVQWRAEAPTP
jgi:hypothetical protein